MAKYLFFPDPLDSHCEFTIGDGRKFVAVPDTHSQGRKGQSVTLPSNTPQGNGAHLVITHAGKVTLDQFGILWYQDGTMANVPFPEGGAALLTDDFRLQDIPNAPPSNGGNQNPNLEPLNIILAVEATHQFDLTTHDGCGKFTEECCKQLHERNSKDWGHVRKFGAQEQFNGHAIDAIMLKVATPNTPAFIYDIIVNSQAPGAHAALNVASAVNESLWYYPA